MRAALSQFSCSSAPSPSISLAWSHTVTIIVGERTCGRISREKSLIYCITRCAEEKCGAYGRQKRKEERWRLLEKTSACFKNDCSDRVAICTHDIMMLLVGQSLFLCFKVINKWSVLHACTHFIFFPSVRNLGSSSTLGICFGSSPCDIIFLLSWASKF